MPKTRRLITNFSKGELSPLLEGRPDLAAYFEGGRTIENFYILRQGGLRRRPGTRFVAAAKFDDRATILIPFEFSVDDAFIIEMGHQYARFYKNRVQILDPLSNPLEIVTPYMDVDLSQLHYTQSADVIFLFHPNYPQQRLSRITDTEWSILPVHYNPPPSFEADTDISDGPDGSGGGVPPSPPGGPTISITSPADGSTVNLFTPTAVTVSVSSDVIGVTLRENDVAVTPENITPPFTVNWVPNSSGTRILTAIARAPDGGSKASNPVNIIVPPQGEPGGGGP